MDVMLDYFAGHTKKKTELKVFLNSGAMLVGCIVAHDEDSIVLKNNTLKLESLIMVDKIISVTPKD